MTAIEPGSATDRRSRPEDLCGVARVLVRGTQPEARQGLYALATWGSTNLLRHAQRIFRARFGAEAADYADAGVDAILDDRRAQHSRAFYRSDR